MIRIGTRKSTLAVAQAQLIADEIEDKLDVRTEIIKISSLGDKDQISKLTSFRGQGVFTSSLERALLNDEIDIAVHSLKDLPVVADPKIPIVAYYKRHSPGDTLLIKKDCIVHDEPLKLVDGVRFATGSPRRQAQFMDYFKGSTPVDIRGNVQTRLSKLQNSFIDALIMATAVFDRIDLELPANIQRIDLDPTIFPPAPGQASIAIQVRDGELQQLSFLNHEETYMSVIAERDLLLSQGGGCELSLAVYITKIKEKWHLHSTYAPDNWYPGQSFSLTRIHLMADQIHQLQSQFLRLKPPSPEHNEATTMLSGLSVVIARDTSDGEPYQLPLYKQGATTLSEPILSYKILWNKLEDQHLLQLWSNAKWIVISSQRVIPFLVALYQRDPRPKKYAVVGMKTASELRKYDFPVHIIAEGSMKHLNILLREAVEDHSGELLYLRGEHYSSKPENCKDIAVYTTEIRNFQLDIRPDYLVVFSSRSAKAIIDQIGPDATEKWVTIGPKTADTIQEFTDQILIATEPSPRGVMNIILEDQQ